MFSCRDIQSLEVLVTEIVELCSSDKQAVKGTKLSEDQ